MAASHRPPRVYLISSAGNPHFGDEVITASWLRFYARHLPEAELWLDTPRPGQTAVLHGDAHPRLRCVDTLFHACWTAPSDDVATCIEHGATVIDNPGIVAREASGVTAALEADLIHVLGGGYINSVWPRHAALLGATRRIAERTGARTAITGAGLTPQAGEAAQSLRDALATFDLVDVRDTPTAEMLAGLDGVTRTGDDALLDLNGQRIDPAVRAGTIVEVQADLIERPLPDLADYVVRQLRAWGCDTSEVLLLESLPPNDTAVLEYLRPDLPHVTVLPFELLWRHGFPLGGRQRWITTRLHTHLMAAASGAWGVALGASAAITSQHQSLVEMGSEWAIVTDTGTQVEAQDGTRHPYSGRFRAHVAAKETVADAVLALVGS